MIEDKKRHLKESSSGSDRVEEESPPNIDIPVTTPKSTSESLIISNPKGA